MEEELISKKDLLEITNISYGQLYRWKRKGLIPEEWFIKKSSYTGQETFFPKLKVLSRIEKIKNMKEDISLDELADVFMPSFEGSQISREALANKNIITPAVLKLYTDLTGCGEELLFHDILSVYVLNHLILSGDINLDEGKLVLEVMKEASIKMGLQASEIILMRKLGVFSCFAVSTPANVCFDSGVRILNRLNMAAFVEEIKLKFI